MVYFRVVLCLEKAMSSSKVAFSCSDHTLGGSAHAMHPCDFALSCGCSATGLGWLCPESHRLAPGVTGLGSTQTALMVCLLLTQAVGNLSFLRLWE